MNIGSFASSNRLLYILVGAISLMVLLTITLLIRTIGGGQTQSNVTLEFWGVYDDRAAFETAITQYERLHQNIKIQYRLFPYQEYEKSVVDALAAGNGPDVWLIDHTWLAKHQDKLSAMPAKLLGDTPGLTIGDFKNQFVEVAETDLTRDGKIYSLPLYVDTLALFYNKDLLAAAGITRPPTTWDEFNDAVAKMTKLDAARNILKSGAALGTINNINRGTDLLMAFMIQSGVQMIDADGRTATFADSVSNVKVGETALQYYTDFANPDKAVYTWNDQQHYSLDAFAEGSLPFLINYSYQAGFIRDRAARLNFAIAPIPQLTPDTPRTYASYWAPAVTKASTHQTEAWDFVNYLASKEGATSYLNATNRPAARLDLIELQKSDLNLGVFARQSLTARSWLQADNVAIEKIFSDMINDVVYRRKSVRDAIQNAQDSVTVLMR